MINAKISKVIRNNTKYKYKKKIAVNERNDIIKYGIIYARQ